MIDLVPPDRRFQSIKIGTRKLSLGGGAKQKPYVTNRSTGLHLSSPPKKGRLFGKSRTSDFVRRIPGNTLLTKALNCYLELNFCRQCIYQRQSRICDTCRLNKLPVVPTLRNCFSESPWKGSDRQMILISGYIPNPLDINHWPSLGLGVDPAAPRLLSEKEFRKQGFHSEPRDSTGGLSPLVAYQSPWNPLTQHSSIDITVKVIIQLNTDLECSNLGTNFSFSQLTCVTLNNKHSEQYSPN